MKIGPFIKPKSGHNSFCGPTALSIISHKDTAFTARVLREVSGRERIKGASTYWMRQALKALGFTTEPLGFNRDHKGRTPTLAQWLKQTASMRGSRVYLVNAGNHWQVVQGRSGASGWGGPWPHAKMEKRRARMDNAYLVTRAVMPASASPILASIKKDDAAKRKEAKKTASVRAQAKALIAKYNLDLIRDGKGEWLVYGPDEIYDNEFASRDDPREGSHFCVGWIEVLAACNDYAKDLEKAS